MEISKKDVNSEAIIANEDDTSAEYEEETLKGGSDSCGVTTIIVRKRCKIC